MAHIKVLLVEVPFDKGVVDMQFPLLEEVAGDLIQEEQ